MINIAAEKKNKFWINNLTKEHFIKIALQHKLCLQLEIICFGLFHKKIVLFFSSLFINNIHKTYSFRMQYCWWLHKRKRKRHKSHHERRTRIIIIFIQIKFYILSICTIHATVESLRDRKSLNNFSSASAASSSGGGVRLSRDATRPLKRKLLLFSLIARRKKVSF